jgi:hypothetical protein
VDFGWEGAERCTPQQNNMKPLGAKMGSIARWSHEESRWQVMGDGKDGHCGEMMMMMMMN